MSNHIEEKIKKAKIQLQTRNSFFGRLILGLEFIKVENPTENHTIGIDYKGNCYYNEKFIESLSLQELIGILAHELLHQALLHHFRFAGREHQIANIAEDICINGMIVKERYQLPMIEVTDDKGVTTKKISGLVPNNNDEIELDFNVCKVVIKECSTKSAEMIYEEIIKQLRDKGGDKGKSMSQSSEEITDKDIQEAVGELSKRLMDEHMKVDKNKMTKKEIQKAQQRIEGVVREALEHSRMRGDTPAGLERIWGSIHEEKFNWKILLQRYITELLPYDQSYKNFGKRTYGTGIYSPMTIREQIDVSVAIDVSGSISEKDLTDFISEIVGVANQFKNRINMNVIIHESEVIDVFKNIKNDDDIKNLKIKGCGGTSFKPVVDYIKKNEKQTKCLIWLTDGYGEEKLERQPFEVIWVLTEDGDDELCKNGKVLWLKDTLN